MLTPGDLITFNALILMYQEPDIKPDRQFFLLLKVVSNVIGNAMIDDVSTVDFRLGLKNTPKSFDGEQVGMKTFLPRFFLQVLYHGRPIWVEVDQSCVLKLV
jgi:hypothetical protein